MKKIWKLLGGAALVAALTPYSITKNEESGEKKIKALLWEAIRTPKDSEKDTLEINIGFISPFEKEEDEEEAHLFADDLMVEYSAAPGEPVVPADIAPEADEQVPPPAQEEAPAEEPETEPADNN